MNVNASAIGTPSGERYSCAASKFARGEISCFARRPATLAGESRKTFRIHEKYAVFYRQTSGMARSFLRVVVELLRMVSDRIESFSILTRTRASGGFGSRGFGIIGI